jgi:hypothetical protein
MVSPAIIDHPLRIAFQLIFQTGLMFSMRKHLTLLIAHYVSVRGIAGGKLQILSFASFALKTRLPPTREERTRT